MIKNNNTLKRLNALFIIVCLFFISSVSLATSNSSINNELDINYYGTKTCFDCIRTENKLKEYIPKIEEDLNISINMLKHDINNPEHSKQFSVDSDRVNIPNDKLRLIPAIISDNHYIVGEDIENYETFKDFLKSSLDDDIIEPSQIDSRELILPISTIIFSGLLDGFNPCAISMLIFFLTFIKNSDKKRVLSIGLTFCVATFLTYLGLGLGLLKFSSIMINFRILTIIMYLITLLLVLTFLALNIHDLIQIKKHNYGNIKNQLPKPIKNKIHKLLKINTESKMIYFVVFFTGVIISVMEFFCTGQVYLPSIVYMISLNLDLTYNIFLLVVYNLFFILPLIFILYLLAIKKWEDARVMSVVTNNLTLVKILLILFFTVLSIYSAYQLITVLNLPF